MTVLSHRFTVDASVDEVRDLVTNLERISEFTQIAKVNINSATRVAPGAKWKNRGATLKIPSLDSSTARDVGENHISWHTRSMVLGIIPVGADWSLSIQDDRGRAEVTNTFERVTMFGLPVGALIKAPFLPMRYLAQGAMLAGQKRMQRTLSKSATGVT